MLCNRTLQYRFPDYFPTLLIIPGYFVYAVGSWCLALIVIIIPAAFLVWSMHLFRGSKTIPRRSFVFLAVISILSVYYFISSWSYGVEYQGLRFTAIITALNLAVACFLLFFGLRSRSHPSFVRNCLFHLSMFAWLSTIAFPWLGKWP